MNYAHTILTVLAAAFDNVRKYLTTMPDDTLAKLNTKHLAL